MQHDRLVIHFYYIQGNNILRDYEILSLPEMNALVINNTYLVYIIIPGSEIFHFVLVS